MKKFVGQKQKNSTSKKSANPHHGSKTSKEKVRDDNHFCNTCKASIGRQRLPNEERQNIISKKCAFMSSVRRKSSLRSNNKAAKSSNIPNQIVTDVFEYLLSITFLSNVELKKTNASLVNANKEQKKKMNYQKKELLSKNAEINSLKKELHKMKIIAAQKDNELKLNEELLETERNASTKSEERIHKERKDRKNHKEISVQNKKL